MTGKAPPCSVGNAPVFCAGSDNGGGGKRRAAISISALGVSLGVVLVASGCVPPPLKSDPHYVLGKPYLAGTVWYYPKEDFDLDETGLAAIVKDSATRLTTDGEVFDPIALTAEHPTIQLPAIARLTNLENGREVTVRLNDRGSGDPHRLVGVTPRTALLLAMPPGSVTRVRLRVLPNESHAAAEALPGAPTLGLSAAPRGAVEVAELLPPPGVRQGGGRIVMVAPPQRSIEPSGAVPPMRMPEAVSQTAPRPGQLMVRLDTFDEYQYAAMQRARMGTAGAVIVSVVDGRTIRFRVEVGPLADIAHADAVLDQALASGIPDARIVVD